MKSDARYRKTVVSLFFYGKEPLIKYQFIIYFESEFCACLFVSRLFFHWYCCFCSVFHDDDDDDDDDILFWYG